MLNKASLPLFILQDLTVGTTDFPTVSGRPMAASDLYE